MELQIENYKDKHEYISENGIRSVVYLMDCIEGLKQIPDKYFELAIVDPPYGLNFGAYKGTNKDRYGIRYKAKDWDKETPQDEYWEQLFGVSKNQIVWGANYFPLPPTQCFIFWYKQNPVKNFADGELAWTSFKKPALCFNYRYYGALQGNTSADTKIHPTQKPVALYEWIIKNFAQPNDKILDTHLGSGSSRIAAHKANLPFMSFELDEDYFNASVKSFNDYVKQGILF